MRDFAKRLIAYETRQGQSRGTKPHAVVLVCEKLRPHLAILMGNAGFRAVLSRALALAGAEVPWLRTLHVNPDGSLERVIDHAAQVAPDEMADGNIVLLAQLLGLLVTFIGEVLTLQLVRDVWPKLPLKDLNLGQGNENEEAK
jgi:hypothetical protein